MRLLALPLPLTLVLALSGAASGANAPAVAGPRRLAPELVMTGTLSGRPLQEVRFAPEAMPENLPLLILEAAPAGRAVRKGDVLLRLDPTRLEEMLKDAEREAADADEELRIAGEEFRSQVLAGDAQVAAAEADLARAETQLRHFREAEAAARLTEQDLGVLGQRHGEDDRKDELDQLASMYGASELAKDTKEIVLHRARRDLERQKAYRELAERNRAILAERTLPLEESRLAQDAARLKTALDAAQLDRRIQMDRKRLEVTKAEHRAGQARRHAQALQRDRKAMTVTALADGMAVHLPASGLPGACELAAERLSPGDRVQPYAGLLCVVPLKPDEVRVRTATAGDLPHLAPGTRATADGKPATIASRGLAPWSRQEKSPVFEVVLAVPEAQGVPGQDVEIRIPLPPVDAAVAVPLTALTRVEDRDTCRVLDAEGKEVLRTVRLGRQDETHAEILEGLAAGEKVCVPAS